MPIHRSIREGRLRLGMSVNQFALAAEVSRGAVQQWERPGGTAPNRARQPIVARLLGISVAELVSGGTNDGREVDVSARVALVSGIEAGNYTVIDNFRPQFRFEMVPVTVPVQRHTYALRVNGDRMVSMTGDSFSDGSLIIVEPELKAHPGDYVVALNCENEITFKQLIRYRGELLLKPLNLRYPVRPLGTATVVGVVREFTKRFR